MQTFKQKLMKHFALNEDEFNALTKVSNIANLPPFTRFNDIEKIVKRIFLALENGEKIVVYGDYDCDGVMATSIVVSTFAKLNYPLEYKLPSRYQDGYGLNKQSVEKFANEGVSLIITVDNGISQIDAITFANHKGIDVIVTDHHELLGELPPSYALMHPTLSSYGATVACGAYVALMLSRALLGYFDDYLVALAGIATISDMMPLVSYNREIVRLTLDLINRNRYETLIKLAETNEVTEQTIAMKIAPKINAVGRMMTGSELNVLVEYMTCGDTKRINDIYTWIFDVNQARKETMKQATANIDDLIDEEEQAIVMLTDENEGMIGLLASRLVNSYERPSIVFTREHNDTSLLKGSARSRKGFNIGKAFSELSDLMVKFGGHELAGGCTIKEEDFPTFKKRFIELAKTYSFIAQIEKVIDIEVDELNFDNYHVYRKLAPYGQGFEPPLFRLKDYPVSELKFSRDGRHIIKTISYGTKLVGFNIDRDYIDQQKTLNLIGELNISQYRNFKDLNFNIRKLY